MMAVLQVLLKVLDHAQRQRSVDLTRTVDAADAREEHCPAAFGSAGARGRGLWGPEDRVGGGGDEVGFHEGLELGVWVAGAEGCDAAVEPGRGVGLFFGGVSGRDVTEDEEGVARRDWDLRVCGLVRASGGFRRGRARRSLRRAGGSSCVLLLAAVAVLLHLDRRWLAACLWLRAVVWESWWESPGRRSCRECLLARVWVLQELVQEQEVARRSRTKGTVRPSSLPRKLAAMS